MNEYALIVAGGSGTRMQTTIPKQFIELNGLPILMHTINAFYKYSNNIQIIIVLPANQFGTWHKLIDEHQFVVPHLLATGGKTRFESVKNGLEKITGNGLVAIHDGVRPLIAQNIIKNGFITAQETGASVAAVTPKDSIRELTTVFENKSVPRNTYKLIQTPQTFKIQLIKEAYAVEQDTGFTDDASVVDKAGHKITLIEGDYRNIKITTPEDIKIAQALLENFNS
jgi:2-C-methyl-D-erythritol 4-phosphate cytidylyltransferase